MSIKTELNNIKQEKINEILKPTGASPFNDNKFKFDGGNPKNDSMGDILVVGLIYLGIFTFCVVEAVVYTIPKKIFYDIPNAIYTGIFSKRKKRGGKRARSKKHKVTKRTNRKRNRGRTHRK